MAISFGVYHFYHLIEVTILFLNGRAPPTLLVCTWLVVLWCLSKIVLSCNQVVWTKKRINEIGGALNQSWASSSPSWSKTWWIRPLNHRGSPHHYCFLLKPFNTACSYLEPDLNKSCFALILSWKQKVKFFQIFLLFSTGLWKEEQ